MKTVYLRTFTLHALAEIVNANSGHIIFIRDSNGLSETYVECIYVVDI